MPITLKRADVKKYSTVLFVFIGLIALVFFTPLGSVLADHTELLTVSLTIGSSAPVITYVVTGQTVTPLDGTTTVLSISFNVSDANGFEDINVSSAIVTINRSGEPDKGNSTCVQVEASGNEMQINCSVIIWYFDANGTWSINVSISDNSTLNIINASETATVGVLTAIQINPSSISFGGSLSVGDTNVSATDDPLVVNNTGNQNFVHVNITAIDLAGTTTTEEYIPVQTSQ